MVLAFLCGVAWIIWGEFTRPRPTREQDQEIMRVLNLYRNAGYTTYHVSNQHPQLFFTFPDKGLDENTAQRIVQRVYIDIYQKAAYDHKVTYDHSKTTAKRVPLPLSF